MTVPFISTDSNGKPLPCAAPDCPFTRTEYPHGARLQVVMNRVPAYPGDMSPRIEEDHREQYHPECFARLFPHEL
jgi:hypothetical protein